MDLRNSLVDDWQEIPSTPKIVLGTGSPYWPDEHTLYLREIHPLHLSNSQMASLINKKFGTFYTRNAVIGKCSRLGLPSRPKPKPSIYPRREVAPRERKRVWQQKPGPQPVEIEPEFICDPIPLLELKEQSCRWPISGEARSIMFCGADKLEPLSYCARHCRIAFDLTPLRSRANYELNGRRMRKVRQAKGLKAA